MLGAPYHILCMNFVDLIVCLLFQLSHARSFARDAVSDSDPTSITSLTSVGLLLIYISVTENRMRHSLL